MKADVKRKDPDAIKNLIKNVVRVKGAKVEVGIVDEDEIHEESGLTVKELAAIHEFGSEEAKIPARPFMEPTMHDNRFKYRAMMWNDAKKLSKGRKNPAVALKEIGEMAADDMRELILKGNFEPLKLETIALKGHSDPLIDSGQMYDAIDYKVTVK